MLLLNPSINEFYLVLDNNYSDMAA